MLQFSALKMGACYLKCSLPLSVQATDTLGISRLDVSSLADRLSMRAGGWAESLASVFHFYFCSDCQLPWCLVPNLFLGTIWKELKMGC